jgi:hypothetical protein
VANAYADPDQLIARLPSLDSHDLDELDRALTAASRWIDGYCARRFWLDTAVTDRVFQACDLYRLELGPYEIGDLTGVVVKTDDGTGTFATTVSASAYQLEPVNAPYAPTGAAPYTTLRALSTTWPVTFTRAGRQDRVKITAKYGWPAIPAPVTQACLTLAVDGFENPGKVGSEAIDGYSVRYTADAESGACQDLYFYRRMWAA